MRNYILVCLLLLSGSSIAQNFKLESGDLIFQEACPDDPDNPIKKVTNSTGNYQFTHVGIVYIDNTDQVFVLEATMPKVSLTPLTEYLYPEEAKKCYPRSVAGRLKHAYHHLIPDALETGLTLVGKDYDYGYVLNNDKYYCSELIYEIFKHANGGKEVFSLNVMTFKSKDTDVIAKGWTAYFDQYNLPVPEGEPGINPGAMSRSDAIEFRNCFEFYPVIN